MSDWYSRAREEDGRTDDEVMSAISTDPPTTAYIRGYSDGWDDGVHLVEEERPSRLVGFVIAALAGGLIVGVLIAIVAHA